MVRPTARRQSQVYLSPCPSELSPRPSSAFDDFCDLDATASRPNSDSFPSQPSSPQYTMDTQLPPTLTDILLDVSSPPWTLTAFMGYLSQNHCMETLEFTLDSQRYAAFYNGLVSEKPLAPDSNDRICALWERLMQVYIIPCAPREINIPARVRDRLLDCPCGPEPPHPSELNEAGRIIYELMNDSLLVPFLESMAPVHVDQVDESVRSPRSPIANHAPANSSRFSRYSRHLMMSTQPLEVDCLTNSSESYTSTSREPMTPPTTPPTSDWMFNSPPGGLQRAVAAHNKGWKKVGAKLGLTRKSSSRRPHPSACDEQNHNRRSVLQSKSF